MQLIVKYGDIQHCHNVIVMVKELVKCCDIFVSLSLVVTIYQSKQKVVIILITLDHTSHLEHN